MITFDLKAHLRMMNVRQHSKNWDVGWQAAHVMFSESIHPVELIKDQLNARLQELTDRNASNRIES